MRGRNQQLSSSKDVIFLSKGNLPSVLSPSLFGLFPNPTPQKMILVRKVIQKNQLDATIIY